MNLNDGCKHDFGLRRCKYEMRRFARQSLTTDIVITCAGIIWHVMSCKDTHERHQQHRERKAAMNDPAMLERKHEAAKRPGREMPERRW